jgi:hypothetical protein
MWTFICLVSACVNANDVLHVSHLYGLLPVCTLTWLTRSVLWMNVFPHVSHNNGLSSVWIFICIARIPFVVNDLLHVSHVYGLPPVCILTWATRLHFWENVLVHESHEYGLSVVWIFICTARLLVCVKNCICQYTAIIDSLGYPSVHFIKLFMMFLTHGCYNHRCSANVNWVRCNHWLTVTTVIVYHAPELSWWALCLHPQGGPYMYCPISPTIRLCVIWMHTCMFRIGHMCSVHESICITDMWVMSVYCE